MMNCRIHRRIAYLALTLAAAPVSLLHAQRLPGRIDGRSRIVLRGAVNPRIEGLTSEGPLDDSARIHGITLRFKPTAEQSADLERLLEEQQDPSSPRYHQWLTPDEFGERFGLSADDLTAVSDWLAAQGFQMDYSARSRTHISFTATVAQVRQAFGAELHRYTVNGRRHFANTRELFIPAQLEPLLYPPSGLDDLGYDTRPRVQPQVTYQDGSHAITPGDLAVIYNIAPLLRKGIDGAGQKIAVAGQSNFNLQDVRDFRANAGLPAADPKLVLTPGSQDPGYADAVDEALLDVEYAGAAAPRASIVYVYGTDVSLATQYAIDQNLAPVLSFSFALCEKRASNSWGWWRNLAQQAAAEGITWVACTGDTGSAGCESQMKDSVGVSGLSAKLPATVPEVTAIGGTTFAEGTGKYWAATTQEDGTSALSYIPEVGWNDTAPNTFLNSTGGGVSIFFARPTWQTAAGLSNDNARHIPDVSFSASGAHDPYLMVETGGIVPTGGTSAGTPFFAGVVALLNHYVVSNGVQARPGLGNINPRLYELARTNPAVFHDVTAGNNIVPCKQGTPDCTTGSYGFKAGAGYDNVTGLGSLDVAGLVENWAVKSTPKSTSLVTPSVDPSPVYQQSPDADGFTWFYTVKLAETGGSATSITGFSIDDYDLSDSIADWFGSTTLPANSALSVDLRSKDLPVPSNHVFAFKGVDASGQQWTKQISVAFLGPKSSSPAPAMSLTSDPASVVKTGSGDPNCSADHPFGQTLILKELNGAAVRLTKFVAGGYDYTDRITAWFGSQTLSASGTLRAKICWQLTAVPTTLDYEMDGVDGSGRQVQATLKVQFSDPLGQKSGGVFPGASGLPGWPARTATTRTAGVTPRQTTNGMIVAPRAAGASASAPVR